MPISVNSRKHDVGDNVGAIPVPNIKLIKRHRESYSLSYLH